MKLQIQKLFSRWIQLINRKLMKNLFKKSKMFLKVLYSKQLI